MRAGPKGPALFAHSRFNSASATVRDNARAY